MTPRAANRGRAFNPLFVRFEGLPEWCTPSLYLVSSGNGVSKVGHTSSPLVRMKALQRDFMSKVGQPIEYLSFFEGAGHLHEESELLEAMSKNFPVYTGREFFACGFDAAFDVVHAAVDRVKPRAISRCIAELETENRRYERLKTQNLEIISRLQALGSQLHHETFGFKQ